MLDWHLCQICYPLEVKLLLLLILIEFLGEVRIMKIITIIILICAATSLVNKWFSFS